MFRTAFGHISFLVGRIKDLRSRFLAVGVDWYVMCSKTSPPCKGTPLDTLAKDCRAERNLYVEKVRLW